MQVTFRSFGMLPLTLAVCIVAMPDANAQAQVQTTVNALKLFKPSTGSHILGVGMPAGGALSTTACDETKAECEFKVLVGYAPQDENDDEFTTCVVRVPLARVVSKGNALMSWKLTKAAVSAGFYFVYPFIKIDNNDGRFEAVVVDGTNTVASIKVAPAGQYKGNAFSYTVYVGWAKKSSTGQPMTGLCPPYDPIIINRDN